MLKTGKRLHTFIGVDPGKSGGLARIDSEGSVLEIDSMPETSQDLYDWFDIHSENVFAVIEKIHSSPQQGVVSAFTFGCGFGRLEMAVVPFKHEFVRPQVWLKGLNIPPRKKDTKTRVVVYKRGKKKGIHHTQKYGGETTTQWKKRLRAKAQQLFPGEEITLKTADALLIAEYCRRKHQGTL